MPNMVTWLRPATQAAGIDIARRVGAFRKLCGGARNWGPWNPLYQDEEAVPTIFAIEPPHPSEYGPLADIKWTVAATPQNNPYGFDIPVETPLFTSDELLTIDEFDLENYPFEYYVTIN